MARGLSAVVDLTTKIHLQSKKTKRKAEAAAAVAAQEADNKKTKAPSANPGSASAMTSIESYWLGQSRGEAIPWKLNQQLKRCRCPSATHRKATASP